MKDRIPYTNCPLCGSEYMEDAGTADCSKHPLYRKPLSPTIQWKKCVRCDHVFTDGYFTDEACALIFGSTNENQKVGGAVEKNRVISSRMIEKVLPYAASGTVGSTSDSGMALSCSPPKSMGSHPIGVDLRRENVEVMNRLGIEAHCQDIRDLSLAESCAVVSMADVLEHMPFPKEGLEAARGLLAEGGVLFISMPNRDCAVWKFLDGQKANPYWGEIEHYHNFGRTRLYELLEETGFSPVRYGISERYRVCMEVVALRK